MQHDSGSMGTCATGATGATAAVQEAQENFQEESVVTAAEELAEDMDGAQYGETIDVDKGIADIRNAAKNAEQVANDNHEPGNDTSEHDKNSNHESGDDSLVQRPEQKGNNE